MTNTMEFYVDLLLKSFCYKLLNRIHIGKESASLARFISKLLVNRIIFNQLAVLFSEQYLRYEANRNAHMKPEFKIS